MTNCDVSQSYSRKGALARVGGSEELLHEVIGLFLEQAPRLTADIRQALAIGDGAAVYRTTHLLRGSASCFGAPSLLDIAQRLETSARDGDVAASANLFATFEVELHRLVVELVREQEVTRPCAS